MNDLASNLKGYVSIVPAAARTDGTVTGTAVEVTGYESVTIAVSTGTVTDGTTTFSLTECDTVGGTYTAVAAADIIGTAPILTTAAADDNSCQIFGYRGSKQFIKVVAVTASSSTGAVFAASVLLGHPRVMPVVQSF